MITIVKPIPYLHTTARNETAYTIITSISTINKKYERQHYILTEHHRHHA